ncbi:MAG: hypothetical protein KQI62_12760 [Deltaproteobacteria bacterium]|nr:hypothetical protein [Deltaproteobacteria bacterium]
MAFAVACGVKSKPIPSSRLLPATPARVALKPTSEGMLISFNIPSAPKPSRAVEGIKIYYGYLPLTGDPACPPCPPRLRKFYDFTLQKGKSKVDPMEGGRFSYLDTAAPMNMEAVYQVVLIDASGRVSKPSHLVRMPRLVPAAPPLNLKVISNDQEVILSWDEVKTSANGKTLSDISGYVVVRKGPEGTKQLNERPLTMAMLKDQTVDNGKDYSYQIFATRSFRGQHLPGQGSRWGKASPKDMKPPAPPSDLAGASTSDSIYLRFTPSPDRDVAGYHVFRKAKGGQWSKISESLVVENVFIDKNVKPEKAYYYRVQAEDEAGNLSEFSEEMDIVHLP